MNNKSLQKMKDSSRVVLTSGQLFWHYSILPFLLIMPVLTTIDVFKYYVSHSYTGVRYIDEMVLWGYIWLIPAVAFYFIQKRRLQFHVIEIHVDATTFKSAVRETAKELDWEIVQQSSSFIVAVSGFSWRSWGERITLIRDKDQILFNSICDPDNRPSVASFGKNKLNRKLFEEYLKKAVIKSSLETVGGNS